MKSTNYDVFNCVIFPSLHLVFQLEKMNCVQADDMHLRGGKYPSAQCSVVENVSISVDEIWVVLTIINFRVFLSSLFHF
jgi:hypothetical protein